MTPEAPGRGAPVPRPTHLPAAPERRGFRTPAGSAPSRGCKPASPASGPGEARWARSGRAEGRSGAAGRVPGALPPARPPSGWPLRRARCGRRRRSCHCQRAGEPGSRLLAGGIPQPRPRSQSAGDMQITAAPGGGGPVERERGGEAAPRWTARRAAGANEAAKREGRTSGAGPCKFGLKRGREIRVSREALGA